MNAHRRVHITGAGLVALATAWSAPASAQSNQELMDIIRQQQRQIEELSRKVDALQAQAATAGGQAPAAAEPGAPAQKVADGRNVEFAWAPAPTVRSKDGSFELQLLGRLFVDGGYIDDDDGFYSGDNATELRAARLGVEGKAWKDIGYKLEIDFADDDVELTDAFVEYRGPPIEPAYLRIGQFKTPNSLEEQTSARFTTFMERGAFTNAFDFDRRIGVGSGVAGASWGLDAGLFGQNAADVEANEGYAIAARGHYAWRDELGPDSVVHLGASTRFRSLDNDADGHSVRYRQRPFFHFTHTESVDTGVLDDADSDIFLGGEHAVVLGPLSVQAEAGHTWLQRDDGAEDASGLWGGYVDVSYFLTEGDRRTYDGKAGVFDRVAVRNPIQDGGWGAWQVGGRVDYVALDDHGADVEGGEQYSLIAGFNWYLNNSARLMLDYAYTHVFDADDAANAANAAANGSSNDVHGIGARAQVDF